MIDLAAIEALASDQKALRAAVTLHRERGWSILRRSADADLIWGERQGSGAAPYQMAVDLRDLASRCSCPSRKLPCKHVLALLLQAAEHPEDFSEGEPPDWVRTWLTKRRVGAPARTNEPVQAGGALRSLLQADATIEPSKARGEPEKGSRRAAIKANALAEGLDALEDWIADQLKLGLESFITEAEKRCAGIASRLVDIKAVSLAARIEELPSRLVRLPREERVKAAVTELGGLVLLIRQFRVAPDDPAAMREIAKAEPPATVLADPNALRVAAQWEVLGVLQTPRKDGYASVGTWLLNLGGQGPTFALLLDEVPASRVRNVAIMTAGEQFEAEIAFYPDAAPLRAVIASRGAGLPPEALQPWPETDVPTDRAMAPPAAAPWRRATPVLLKDGRLGRSKRQSGPDASVWWREASGRAAAEIEGTAPPIAFGLPLLATAALWDGHRLKLMAAHTPLGRVSLIEDQ
ncbi:MAG: SWIM zinc finger family protein [Pseudomonadota bacterium]